MTVDNRSFVKRLIAYKDDYKAFFESLSQDEKDLLVLIPSL